MGARFGFGFVEVSAFGVAVGVSASAVNAVGLPTARFAGYLLNSGWLWASVAVAAGWWTGTRGRGAVAGPLALLATTGAYYATDSVVRGESMTSYWYEMRVWFVASIVVGSVLGIVGASARRPGPWGLLARLAVPVGAAVEMVWLPRWDHRFGLDPALDLARILVWVASALCMVVLARSALERRTEGAR